MPTFYNVVTMRYNYDYTDLQQIAEKADISEDIINEMFVGVAIHRTDAEKILAAFSQHTGETWNLNNVQVALLEDEKK